jgi:hypothetical protein
MGQGARDEDEEKRTLQSDYDLVECGVGLDENE